MTFYGKNRFFYGLKPISFPTEYLLREKNPSRPVTVPLSDVSETADIILLRPERGTYRSTFSIIQNYNRRFLRPIGFSLYYLPLILSTAFNILVLLARPVYTRSTVVESFRIEF